MILIVYYCREPPLPTYPIHTNQQRNVVRITQSIPQSPTSKAMPDTPEPRQKGKKGNSPGKDRTYSLQMAALELRF